MPPTTVDRAAGAIVGSLIGDALSVGPHWYYDLDEQRRDYGEWINDYAPPKEGRYHYPLEAGELSQTGQITVLVTEAIAEAGDYELGKLTRRFDLLLDTLDGTPKGGRYTDHAIRNVWKQRKTEGRPWAEVGSHSADTADAAIFLAPLAARYSGDLHEFGRHALLQARLTHRNPIIVGNAISWGLALAAVVRGEDLATVAKFMNEGMQAGTVPKIKVPIDGEPNDFFHVGPATQAKWAWLAAHDNNIKIEPASQASLVFGMACAQHLLLPAAYYLVSRFPTDFESAVLHAVNGGGHNLARASLTGAMSGAMVGLSGIPQRFIAGLKDSEKLVGLAQQVAEAGATVEVG